MKSKVTFKAVYNAKCNDVGAKNKCFIVILVGSAFIITERVC